ncbi:MAG TPA: hypothetical protein VMT54_12370 [Candidatus Cybelea sp.]|nr:hypothetical protein [Candidatus Cybelea sp.]
MRRDHLLHLLPALALVLLGTAALGYAELRPIKQPRTPFAVLTPNGDAADALRIVAAADGRLISAGGWLGGAVAVSDDPDFAAKLYRAGARLVLRVDGATGCAGLTRTLARTS